jgi:hypothetical protein
MQYQVEAVLLGFAMGPACLASCGPVLFPWLAAAARPLAGTAFLLAQFLAGRLAGYLVFAAAAWLLGFALPLEPPVRAAIFGAAHLAIAAALIFYALRLRKPKLPDCGSCAFSSQVHRWYDSTTPAVLGFLTGVNLCPPFVGAAVRAAEAGALSGAELFFVLFFAGTAVWFVPALAIGFLQHLPAAAVVARMTMVLLGGYYGYAGVISLGRSVLYG